MNKIKGIVFEHGNNDWSIWIGAEMSNEDQHIIRTICKKYMNDGCSVRGKDVCEDIKKIMEG